jgi:gamma-glutamyltranspeptidase/glutathione hydrolase
MFRFVLPLFSCIALAACGEGNSSNAPQTAEPEKPAVSAKTTPYVVATAHPLATKAGEDILAQGGSAVDAAVAVQAVLSLVEPQSSGLAGGAFLLHYDPSTDELVSYDGREIAPASASPDMFLKEDGKTVGFYDAVTGGHSVGVPGVVAMLDMAHKEHGALELRELLKPARALAENGFEVTPRMHNSIARMTGRGRLGDVEPAASYFMVDGEPLPVGHLLKNPAYAETLEHYAALGAPAFYTGPVAEGIIEAVNQRTGEETLVLTDFTRYAPVKREPLCVTYRSKKVCSMGPPSSGGTTVLQILKLLEATDFADEAPASPTSWHMLLEASRLAYADRNLYLADPDYMRLGDLKAEELLEGLLNEAYLQERATAILKDRSAVDVAPGDPAPFIAGTEALGKDASPEPPSTSHFSIMDGQGRVVSMTTSVEFPFGSHLMAGGMILNNQLTDFSFLPEQDGKPVANAPAAGKRPRSSMSPVIIFNEDGSVYGALGSPGGPAIIGYVAKTIVAHLDWGMSLQDAIDAPNIVVPRGGVLVEEDRLDAERLDALKAFGHEPSERALTSGVYGYVITPDGIQGGADKRREGTVAIGE